MEVLKNVINIGIDKPFTFLHVTDTHFTETDLTDSEERRLFAKDRRDVLFSETRSNVEFIERYVKEKGYPLYHTGDLIDFFTPENFRRAKSFYENTNMTLIAGNHEIHTCPNNVFCEEDFTVDLNFREERLDTAQKWFGNDIRYFCKEINGVYLVGINNYDYQISAQNFERLKLLSKEGKPIILFMHIPLYSKELYMFSKCAMLAMPKEIVDGLPEFQQFEQRADKCTYEAVEFIKSNTAFKAIICGHLHFAFESDITSDIKQYVTGLNSIREITVI